MEQVNTNNNSHTKLLMTPHSISLSRKAAAAYVSVSPTYFDELVASGIMPAPKMLGTKKVWYTGDLELAVINLPSMNDPANDNTWTDAHEA